MALALNYLLYFTPQGNVMSQLLSDGMGSVPYFEKAIALNPAQPQPHFNLGNELARLDRYAEAS